MMVSSESDPTWISSELDHISDQIQLFLSGSSAPSSISSVQDVFLRLQRLFLVSHLENDSSNQAVITYLEVFIKNVDLMFSDRWSHDPQTNSQHFYEIIQSFGNVVSILESQPSPVFVLTDRQIETGARSNLKRSAKLLLEIMVSFLPTDGERLNEISRFLDERIIARMNQEGEMVCGQFSAFEIFVKQYPQFLDRLSLFPHYFQTRQILGKGAYATVYVGYHKETGRKVAIKKMDEEALRQKDPSIAKKLKNEELIMKSLSHPNIVRLHETYRNAGTLNLILEYCGGGTLAELLEAEKKISEQKLKVWLSQIASGLKYLRERSIVHRDLKPQNIMIADGVLKLADFTYARYLREDELAETFCGTPLYMAPEILGYRSPSQPWNINPRNGSTEYSDRSDLWSIGIISFQLIYGTLPWQVTTFEQLRRALFESPVRFPPQNISAECLELISGLLKKDPRERIDWIQFFSSPFLKPVDSHPPSPTPSPSQSVVPSTPTPPPQSIAPPTPISHPQSVVPSTPTSTPSAVPPNTDKASSGFPSTPTSTPPATSNETSIPLDDLSASQSGSKSVQSEPLTKAPTEQRADLQERIRLLEHEKQELETRLTERIGILEEERNGLKRALAEAEQTIRILLGE